ncbi:histidine kinase [Flavobacterium psychrophilum]|nr:histidine kinase [Flavobacterium psychrophilum]AOE52637.1 histidine kinase [Flavobacterium psychrophilum]
MKQLQLYQLLFLRIVLIIIAVGSGFLLLQKDLVYTASFIFLVFILLLFELFAFIRNTFLFYDKTISAILNNDFSADFSRLSSFENYRNLFRLYDRLKNMQNEQVSKDIVYRSILNNIETGVLILEKKEADWGIFLMNDYFSEHFTVPKVSKWSYLRNQIPALCSIIEERDFSDMRTSLQVRVGNTDSQTFMLQTSKTKTYDTDYYIILLDSIQKVIAKKEKDAWINLMKVISHELMNSITPIRSLAQNMEEIVAQDDLSKDDLNDIKESVSAMIHRSDHLQNFIDSYRKLAMLPSPNKEVLNLETTMNGVLKIMAPLFKNAGVTIHNTIGFNRRFMADALQLEQVLINLFTNSIYALEGLSEKEITITAEFRNGRIFITITDTGNGIDPAIEDKIFLPFFTTRKEGAGIGLTLSKNIIEAHGGYLTYQNEGNVTQFTICLIE